MRPSQLYLYDIKTSIKASTRLLITKCGHQPRQSRASFIGWIKKFPTLLIQIRVNYVGGYGNNFAMSGCFLGQRKRAPQQIIKILKYQWLLLKLLPNQNGIFFHSVRNMFWAPICCLKFSGKTSLWYTHKSVN